MPNFTSEVKAAAKRINESVDTVNRNVVHGWFNQTVRKTPVDTGRLQGNWQVSKDTPKAGTVSRTGKSGPLADIGRTVLKPGLYYLVNNLPYAPVAEYGRWGTGDFATFKTTRDGFSIQAPYGMARISLVEAKAKLRRLGVK